MYGACTSAAPQRRITRESFSYWVFLVAPQGTRHATYSPPVAQPLCDGLRGTGIRLNVTSRGNYRQFFAAWMYRGCTGRSTKSERAAGGIR